MRPLLRFIATGAYTGFFPFASGTAGSLLGLALWLWLPLPLGQDGTFAWTTIVFLVFAAGIGVPASKLGEDEFGEDASPIVWDEVVGQWITVVAVAPSIGAAMLGFVLFRLFDIVKPWPAGKSQEWTNGWGVMADDVFAGIYARIALHFLLPLLPEVLR
ncbi:MAG: phosphatidylglycerophosphatase A [Gemmatimonadetes bacterium]|nr:phosphatidylglycerophosphatase A [Gemmatimonadota bacterium]